MEKQITKHSYLKETEELCKKIEEGFLILAERLFRIREERLWEEDYDNFAEFLLKIQISESMASKLISIHQNWVLKFKMKVELLADIPWTTLYNSIPLLEKENPKELVEELKLLTRGDAEEKVREFKNGNCVSHEWVSIRFCKKCGKREKIYPEE